MALENGSKLGTYQILSPLGAGGMVRFIDPKLKRDVEPGRSTDRIPLGSRLPRDEPLLDSRGRCRRVRALDGESESRRAIFVASERGSF